MQIQEIEQRIIEAVTVERAMQGDRPRSRFCNWPDMEPDPNLAYGYNEAECRIIPTAQQIDRYSEVMLDWLPLIAKNPQFKPPRLYQNIVLMRAILASNGKFYGYRVVAAKLRHIKRMSHETCRKKYEDAIHYLECKIVSKH